MANVLLGDVWSVDTAATLAATGNPVAVWSFLWTCLGNIAGPRVQVTDAAGRSVFESACGGFIAYSQPINVNGLIVTYIATGKLFIQVG